MLDAVLVLGAAPRRRAEAPAGPGPGPGPGMRALATADSQRVRASRTARIGEKHRRETSRQRAGGRVGGDVSPPQTRNERRSGRTLVDGRAD